mmetsp:Transcript_13703/g.28824  ORF Transcript_13703/g.28824 Transcript_13703/m.28824 type:complete len:503 (-) Transcript_13703:30-1538(-)
MIDYGSGYFGLNIVFQLNGSAAYKAILYSILSCSIYVLIDYFTPAEAFEEFDLGHPYPVAALVAVYTVLLSTKLVFMYNRFWEACTALHNMQSKWLDVGTTMAAYHYQCKAYENIQPPSFGEHPEINNFVREKEGKEFSPEEQIEQIKSSSESSSIKSKFSDMLRKKKILKHDGVREKTERRDDIPQGNRSIYAVSSHPEKIPRPRPRNYHASTPSDLTEMNENSGAISIVAGEMKEVAPSPFLLEGAHLVSLLSAVALSTLRNDIEGVEAPLTEFVPGSIWPAFNSYADPSIKRDGFGRSLFLATFRFLFDVSRTEQERALYNVNRPFRVIGGISDGEAAFLQSARGPSAKVALVNMWLNEFTMREHLHGSMGNVGPPIISRLQQYQSDGFLWYNAARKMSYIPFPLPHAQLTVIFLYICTALLPILMISFTEFWSGLVLNFLGLFVIAGLHLVSNELEYPFRNAPNDLPLNLFQAQFNEGLLTMFAGYHPDSWWEIKSTA